MEKEWKRNKKYYITRLSFLFFFSPNGWAITGCTPFFLDIYDVSLARAV